MQTENRWLRDGLAAGFVAYAAVALVYTVFDVLASRGMFFTVNLLGQATFRGLRDPAVLQFPLALDAMAAFLYNAVHLGVSLGIGLVVMGLVEQAEREPRQARLVSVLIAGGFIVTIMVVGVLTEPLRALVPWWSVVTANAVASVASAAYVVRSRPGIVGRMLRGAP